MASPRNPIRILASAPNEIGDLFAELVTSFFSTLGYEKCRTNIHKSGREIDVDGSHRLEAKRVIAECKATGQSIGGGDVNKFYGALDAERRTSSIEVAGYFISLNGFTQTAIEQEKSLNNERLLMLDGQDVIEGLIVGRILVSRTAAFSIASICASSDPNLTADPVCEILAHPLGFIWAIYFLTGKLRTHVSLIHADGTALHRDLARELLTLDNCSLVYLDAPGRQTNAEAANVARKTYLSYIESECGEIQLEGLPADQEVGTRKLRLESIFVPSHLISSNLRHKDTQADTEGSMPVEDVDINRLPAGDVLRQARRVAVLGLPGSGKSTLLKRLSTAYAFPERMKLVDDNLPLRSHLPIFIRCRQLGEGVRLPILEILKDIPKRIEMLPDIAAAFSVVVQDALRGGHALLLVDGLDEISNPGDRVAFVTQLRTFLHRYPAISFIVTSREAGFRIVGSALNTVCEHFTLADFDDADIMRLTLGWHKEVVGDRPDIVLDAADLGERICSTPRVKELAENPLLLTTLLLVRRWVGSLPTKRSVLYAKAIEVLLATWNVEGHQPLEQDEVVPQLEYLAFSMMRDGTQQIGLDLLKSRLVEARAAMPEILSYTKISPSELIDRIELRSSLLMQSGVDVVDGTLMPVYEFRHLTFQEYLCAQAIVNNHYPGASDSDTPLSILTPFLGKESWEEAVLLTMVLAGRRAAPLVQELMRLSEIEQHEESESGGKRAPGQLLLDAIVDEIPLTPDLLRSALKKLISCKDVDTSGLMGIYKGKYKDSLLEVATKGFFDEEWEMLRTGSVLAHVAARERGHGLSRGAEVPIDTAAMLQVGLRSNDWQEIAFSSLLVMELAYRADDPSRRQSGKPKKKLQGLDDPIPKLIESVRRLFHHDQVQIRLASIWAFNWLNELREGLNAKPGELLNELFRQWMAESNHDLKYVLAWAISTFDLLPRSDCPFGLADQEKIQFLHPLIEFAKELDLDDRQVSMFTKQEVRTALVVAYYLRAPLNDETLLARMRSFSSQYDRHLTGVINELSTALDLQPD